LKKDQAAALSDLIEKGSHSILTTYEIRKLETVGEFLPHFHQWTNGKQTIAGYEVIRFDTNTSYFFLFIDWHRNENYYLVIYAHDKSTTLAELRQIEEVEGAFHFVWKYNPLKRDGKNAQRKAYFKSTFGSPFIRIKLPSTIIEVNKFFDQLFQLCQNRSRADKIVDVFDLT
jgi:hypothetical protein